MSYSVIDLLTFDGCAKEISVLPLDVLDGFSVIEHN